MNYTFLIAILVTIFSCNNNNRNTERRINSNIIRDTTILDTSILNSSDTNNLQINKIDTIKYSNLHFWDTTMDRFDSAYIDTFSVGGNQFRFINPIANKPQLDIVVYLEKLVYDKWVYTGFTLGTMNHVYEYEHSRDVNGDGFIDITQNYKWNQAVYFYDPQIKSYRTNSNWLIREEYYTNSAWTLIDTPRKIFCDFFAGKEMCGDIHSTLYTYNGFQKEDLYDLELYNCTKTNNDTHLVTKLILNKCLRRKYYDPAIFSSIDSLVEIKEIPLSKPLDLDKDYDERHGYFNYVQFWKGHYRSLFGYR